MAKKPSKTATTRSRKSAPAKSTAGPSTEPKTSKQNMVLAMLRRQDGASAAEIVEATGWQPHSVRGFMSGALKKQLQVPVVSDKDETDERRYRVAPLKTAS